MNSKNIVEIDESNSLLSVLNLLKKNVVTGINTSSLALYKETIQAYDNTKKYGIIKVNPFPLRENQPEYSIEAYVLDCRAFETDQIVVIAYTDLVFVQNLIGNYKTPVQAVNPNNLHSQQAAVLIEGGDLIKLNYYSSGTNHYLQIIYSGYTYTIKLNTAPTGGA